MENLKKLLFKNPTSSYANAFIQTLEEIAQKGNDITKEQFTKYVNSISKDLINENVDIDAAYSQFITDYMKKNNPSSNDEDYQPDEDILDDDILDEDIFDDLDDDMSYDKREIASNFYSQVSEILLDQSLTFTQSFEKADQLKETYVKKYGNLCDELIDVVNDYMFEIQNIVDDIQARVTSKITANEDIQSLSDSELETKVYDEVSKSAKELKIDDDDKDTHALIEKAKEQIVDTIVQEIKPVEEIQKTIQDIKAHPQLREIDKINKIIELMKNNYTSEFKDEIKKLERIRDIYYEKMEVLANQIFDDRAMMIADIEDKEKKEKAINKFNSQVIPTLEKKFKVDISNNDVYKNLADWDNSSKLVEELSEDILKTSNLEELREIEKIEQYIQVYKSEKKDAKIKKRLDELKDIQASYLAAKKDISTAVRKSIQQNEAFENLNDKEKEKKIVQLIDGNLNLYAAIRNFEHWDNPEKLKEELKEDIDKEVLKPKKRKIENKGKDVSKWKKAMIGSLGFVTGIGLNVALKAHPVLGTVASAYTLSRTIYNAGKLTCSISTKINKGNEPKIISGIKHIIPKKVKNIAKAIFERPKNPYFRSFVNGLSLGYTTANIYQKFMVPKPDTTVTVVDQDKLTTPSTPKETNVPTMTTDTPKVSTTPKVSPTPKISNAVNQTPTVTTPSTPSVASVTPASDIISTASNTNIPSFESGTVMDISGLEYGYAGPGQSAVHLLNNRGVNAVFDKTNVINGQTWVHFKQANGAGYAWFPKEQVEEMLENISSGRTR